MALQAGLRTDELLDSGEDILAREYLAHNIPSFQSMQKFLPTQDRDAYWFVSGAITRGAILVDLKGQLFDQEENSFYPGKLLSTAVPFFSPNEMDADLTTFEPTFQWVEDAPILSYTYKNKEDRLVIELLVQPLDSGTHPTVYLEAQRLVGSELIWSCNLLLCQSGLQEIWPQKRMCISKSQYLSARLDTIVWWHSHEPSVTIQLCEAELVELFHRCLQNARITCNGSRAQYGHAFYGNSLGDNFPPNYLTLLETALLTGQQKWAQKTLQQMMEWVVSKNGELSYYGASAAEYGQWLWLVHRAVHALEIVFTCREYAEPVNNLALHLLSLRGQDGLIQSGAEADTRFRVAVYTNNNLWAVRGLHAAASLLDTWKIDSSSLKTAADTLFLLTQQAMKHETVQTRFGAIPPFRMGYPALPWTLSACRETTVPLNFQVLEQYLKRGYPEGELLPGQDLSENTYANYRYYPEMLSSALLTPLQATAIQTLRRNAGGELLCMTRFYRWLDDWPAFHYARYLLQSGQRDSYLTLMYAHAVFHGNAKMGVYYEQVSIEGSVVAEDCLPSLLLVPMMVIWALVFQPVGETALDLGKGVPTQWYETNAIGIQNTLTEYGSVSWCDQNDVQGNRVFSCDLPYVAGPVRYYPPYPDVLPSNTPGIQMKEHYWLLETVKNQRTVYSFTYNCPSAEF